MQDGALATKMAATDEGPSRKLKEGLLSVTLPEEHEKPLRRLGTLPRRRYFLLVFALYYEHCLPEGKLW
ncbi:hypothetical protein Pfo_024439 [Paulownia fortunei]|nr:hypothetical protein Pfo_024439 [Paulownia fortunei]